MGEKTIAEHIPAQNSVKPEYHGIYYTPQEPTDLWKCSIGTVYAILRQGKLTGFKLVRDGASLTQPY